MSDLTQQEVLQLISMQLEKAEDALLEASRLAKKHDIASYVDWSSVHQGMAGYLTKTGWEPENSNWDSSSANC
jgi:peptide subunit release factor 1 (eRF1)